jgi:hypothetical protein
MASETPTAVAAKPDEIKGRSVRPYKPLPKRPRTALIRVGNLRNRMEQPEHDLIVHARRFGSEKL